MTLLHTDIPDELRLPLLQAALSHVPFEGWSDKILMLSAQDLNIDPALAKLAFPEGITGMIDLLALQQDQKMIAACTTEILAPLKIREKITLLVRSRIEAEEDNREAARNALTYLALPAHTIVGLKILYRTVDTMWKTIHDSSTDFNYYTKRLTLSGVYTTTLFYWLNDDSKDYVQTWDFLDRRIANVMQFEKSKAQIRTQFKTVSAKLPVICPDFGTSLWASIRNLKRP